MCRPDTSNPRYSTRTIFYHFVGAVPLSTSLFDMLQRLLKDLCDVSGAKAIVIITHTVYSIASSSLLSFYLTLTYNFCLIVS